MRQKNYFIFAVTLLLLIPLVLMTFASISDRKIASLIAGTMFLFLPCSHLWKSYKLSKAMTPWIWWATYLQFILLFALPIYYLRIAYFDLDFSDLSLFGISTSVFHKYSSYSYSVIIVSNIVYFLKARAHANAQA